VDIRAPYSVGGITPEGCLQPPGFIQSRPVNLEFQI
jgi:hypothetical protein